MDSEVFERVLMVRGLPDDCTKEWVLQSTLGFAYGDPVSVIIRRYDTKPTVVFIKYDTNSGATNTLIQLNGRKVMGSKVTITYAKRKVTPNLNISSDTNNTVSAPEVSAINAQMTSTPIVTNDLSMNSTFNALNVSQIGSNGLRFAAKAFIPSPPKSQINGLANGFNQMAVGRPKLIDNYVSRATIEDIASNKDLLTKIFDNLTFKQRFGIKRVCRLWDRVVKEMMAFEPCITFGLKRAYGCCEPSHRPLPHNDLSAAIVSADGSLKIRSVEKLATIIHCFKRVECLHFANCYITPIALKWMITHCEHLKCLRFDNIQGLVKTDWTKFEKPLSEKLIHFSFAGNTLNDWQSVSRMVSSFKLLEQLVIADCVQDMTPVFRSLSPTLDNLAIIRCDRLSPKAIDQFRRRNAPNLRVLAVDFGLNDKYIPIIIAFYETCLDLDYFRASNIPNQYITHFSHDFSTRGLKVVVKRPVPNLNLILDLIGHDFITVQITGPVLPSMLETVATDLPDCRILRLNECDIYCDCDLELNQLIGDQHYSCEQCCLRAFNSLNNTLLDFWSFNGEEYERKP